MKIEDFLRDRLLESRMRLERSSLPRADYDRLMILVESGEELIEWHKNWPVLLETPPKLETSFDPTDTNYYTMTMTQQLQFLTQEEYRKKFGSEPPTAPLLQQWASKYHTHPDFQEEWRVS